MELCSSSKTFSAIPVRDLLKKIDFHPTCTDDLVTLGLVFGTSKQSLNARGQSHLTNATEQESQIRFPLKDRVRRSLVKLASSAQTQLNQREIFEVRLMADDFVSFEFFSQLKGCRIVISESDCGMARLSNDEIKLLSCLAAPARYVPEIILIARERLYASDYRTAFQLLSCIPQDVQTDQVHYILGLCHNFFGETTQSEMHFRKMLESESPLSRVQSAYVTSMLYLRMHDKEKQDLSEAENLLQGAYATLMAHPEIEDVVFHRVFNRNGFALCLYRRGDVKGALGLLEQGILHLQEAGSGAAKLHQSVLIYNAVQCLRTLKLFSACEDKCSELLAIDPKFPEYHLEQARVYLDQGKYELAFSSLSKAEGLDAFIPELHALKGYACLQIENLAGAEMSYRRAAELDPSNPHHAADLDYCLEALSETARGTSA